MNALVSVIVPVYNVEKQLKKCVNSITRQTHKNLEIILIDDGSPDNCPKMCDYFAKKDPRIKVIHKENEGVSVARNVGIDRATGEYIVFVDSDDWLPSNSIKDLVTSIEKTNSDCAMGAIKWISFPSYKINNATNGKIGLNNINDIEVILESVHQGPCSKIYKSLIIKELKVYFPKGIKYGEDTIFLWNYLSNCESACLTSKVLYFYNRLFQDSACTKYYSCMHEWYEQRVKLQVEVFKKVIRDKSIDVFITNRILEALKYVFQYHVYEAPSKKDANKGIKQTWNSFKHIFEDNNLCKKISSQDTIYSLCINNEFEKIYDYFIKTKPKNNFAQKAKKIIKRIGVSIKKAFIYGAKNI